MGGLCGPGWGGEYRDQWVAGTVRNSMMIIEKISEIKVVISVLANYNALQELVLGFTLLLLKPSIIKGSMMRSSSPNWKRHPPIWTPRSDRHFYVR